MTDKTACVIVPTYNEADSIGQLIDALCADLFPGIRDWTLQLLIVDGHSPDGTAEVVRGRQGRFSSLHLLSEPSKRGIGAAYILGFEQAIKQLDADVVIEFDGDLQHPPETIPLMLRAIDAGYDYILGSRRIPGGGYPAGWSFYRNLLSRGGGWVARLLLFFPTRAYRRVTDPTTGLKATRVAGLLDHFNWGCIRSLGFGYKIELLYHFARQGARISEVPLRFGLRVAGESKITSQTPREIFGTALRLRAEDARTNVLLAALLARIASYLLDGPVKTRSTVYPA
jgi:glycosyltransferase involved in cell wall biosynthesis